jgi:phage shock protein PspC (stress-responsive transcriptional regulator)
MTRRLYRSVRDRRIGGVAAGTAEYFDIDPSIARVLWVLLAIFTGGAFLIAYLVMWAIVPEEPWDPDTIVGTASVPGPGISADSAGAAAAGSPAAGTSVPPPSWTPSSASSSGPSGRVILGAILILIGGWALAREFIPGFNWGLLWPIGLVVIGVIILLAAVRRPN